MASETRLLYRHIDDPALRTLEGYRGYGGYTAIQSAFRREPDRVLSELGSRGDCEDAIEKCGGILRRAVSGSNPLRRHWRPLQSTVEKRSVGNED